MVTFALPGEYDAADAGSSTPMSRPPLPFAKRTYVATPYAHKRLGTPHTAPSRKLLIKRDEVSSGALNRNGVSSRSNLFKASVAEDLPTSSFSPSIPQSTMKKVFAPGATPEPSRVYRESTARLTPRGLAAHSSDKELFNMRISSPPPELTGEVLANRVPKDWNAKGSIYADQFLAHLCPPDLDDEQRRQFFCILDLRRLKYAANEIFSNKTWKLNIMNFAKEFEKSRSIILLRYGLYEFQSVKPSKEVLKRWRREHGLPDPEEEEEEEQTNGTPSKPMSVKKRKADDDLSKETADATENVATASKRRATVSDEIDEPTAVTPAPNKNKRKTVANEASPAKLQKATPSTAKSLFVKIASKPAATPTSPLASPAGSLAAASPAPSPTPFKSVDKNAANGKLSRSVFNNSLKPPVNGNGNIFGYLSDASSAKNSGVEADAESESESDEDEDIEDSQEGGQSDEPSGAASGAGDVSSQAGSNLFGTKPSTGFGTGVSSAAGTRDSTPGRSLFDRITKDQDGQPVRADDESADEVAIKKPASSINQTWNPTTQPLKFAPTSAATQNGSLFGKATSTSTSTSIFAPKSTAPSNIFGVSKQDQSSKANTPISEADLAGGESDKENDSQPTKKVFSEPKVSAIPSTGASLFGLKPAAAEPVKVSEPPATPAAAPSSAPLSAPSPAPTTNLFGTAPAAPPATTTPVTSTNLFGAAAPAPTSTSTSLFGASTPAFSSEPAKPKPALSSSTSLFGTAAPAAAPTSLFGAPSAVPAKKDPSPPAASQPAAAPLFSFGSAAGTGPKPTETSQQAAKSLFGAAPKSPPASFSTNSLFGGSPMKQDDASPAKKQFTGLGTDTSAPPPVFNFGTAGGASSSSSSNLFGSSMNSAPAPAAAPLFGAAPSNTGSGSGSGDGSGGGFNFNFGSGGAGPSSGFSNPFSGGNASGNPTQAPTAAPGGMFAFGSSTPAGGSGGSGMFQFGNGAGSQPSQPSVPLFNGAASNTSVPSFTATAPSGQSSSMFAFGASQPSSGFNLAPPAGGSSTTGTNSPFNLGGGSSLATTPAGGTPEPSTQVKTNSSAADNNDEEGEKHEQISLTEGADKDEEVLHEVRAKVLKFVPAGEASDAEEKKSKSPWATQGVGALRLLKHKETNAVRLLLRAEPRGNVAMNRSVLPDLSYKADEKYVKMTTSNDKGDGLETWMIQVKTKDLAKSLAEALETHKALNKK
ncbi:hypothetical protein TRIATDRAFT_226605 [Trichoderma atroviride IMI 206040]|uniref:RanBD1 domain-containing protein n=1 Tax=Hypocrea atroviridis (strain ATCC 20476 / IMI 206040) TaxID=452589 RepID=G9P6V1_HYPAI|nr:uncharacterized protein TRIATDRAFT_226605 [Trichoderma atroviride IMI 206040]EHK40676.1 hypothetical protein TRIATDRAFT_226605 [Trichoderma atroviride IMI 206040]